jgi:hypothetical protein
MTIFMGTSVNGRVTRKSKTTETSIRFALAGRVSFHSCVGLRSTTNIKETGNCQPDGGQVPVEPTSGCRW